MVHATKTPATLQVSFFSMEQDVSRVEIVCIVRPCDKGMEINYSHHCFWSRSAPTGPWKNDMKQRLELSPMLLAEISYCVPAELWRAFGQTVRLLPVPIESVSSAKW